jgi:hypothetical protein
MKVVAPRRMAVMQSFARVNSCRGHRREALIEFDSANGGELLAAKKFFYLAGLNDAMRMFNLS